MQKIGIFCSASGNIDTAYFDAARELGEWMGKNSNTLVYGGSSMGLMDCIARAVKATGGEVIGVVPSKLEEKGKVSTLLDKTIRTRDLSERKDIMLQESDVMVALPGGVGTLDEVFHVMASSSIGYHQKKNIFYNQNGYYDDLLAILERMYHTNFARHPLDHYYTSANTLTELIEHLTPIIKHDRVY